MTCGCGLTRRGVFAGALAAGAATAAGAAPPRPGRIDVHHHIAPPAWLTEAWKHEPGPTAVARWTPEASLADMDAAGVETAVVSITQPGTFADADPAVSRRIARESNEYARRLCDDHKGRFAYFAALPLNDVDGSLREIEYAFDKLGASGVALMTSYGRAWLGDRRFFPVWEELDRRGAVAYTHPLSADCCRNLQPGVPPTIVEFGADTTRAVASIVFGGAAARFPRLRWIFSHAGGATPFLIERFSRQGAAPAVRELYPRGVEAELARFFYDTAQASNRTAMQALRSIAPAPQILFGTDYPYRTSAEHVDGLRRSGVFSRRELAAVERGNALRLMPGLA